MESAVGAVALCGAFLLKTLPHSHLLLMSGAVAAAMGALVLFGTRPAEGAYRYFLSALTFFIIVAECRGYAAPVFVSLAAWGWRQTTHEREGHFLNYFASELLLGTFAAVWAGGASILQGSAISLFVLVVGRAVSSRFSFGKTTLSGEAFSTALLVLIHRFEPMNLVFLQNPLFSVAAAVLTGVLIHKGGMLEKRGISPFSLVGTLFYAAVGFEGFLFFLLFTIIMVAGTRLHPSSEKFGPDNTGASSLYVPLSMVSAGILVLSMGATDPFPFYFALSGVMAAGVFQVWSGIGAEGEYGAGRIFLGFVGTVMVAGSAWIFSFLPPNAIPLFLPAGGSVLAMNAGKGMLASPERDWRWLTGFAGAITAFIFSRAFIP